MSIIGLEMQQMKLLQILRDAAETEEKLNREREKAGLSPLPRQFFLREEHESALAAAAPKATPEKPKYNWFRLGQDQPPADDGFDPDAAYEKLRASLPPPKTAYDRGYNAGFSIAFLAFDPRCIAWNAREQARRAKHAASPEGRAEAAWCAMWDRANELLKDKGGAAAFMAETPPAPAAPVVVATAEGVLRARAVAAGTITPLPVDPVARQVLAASRKARGESKDKPL